MSRDETEAATIRPPRRGECRQLAGTAATQVFKVPAEWFGKKVRFEALNDTFWVQTAVDETISITPGQLDTITGSGASAVLAAPSNAVAEPIRDGYFKEFDFFSGVDMFIGIRATGTAGTILFRMAEVQLGSS